VLSLEELAPMNLTWLDAMSHFPSEIDGADRMVCDFFFRHYLHPDRVLGRSCEELILVGSPEFSGAIRQSSHLKRGVATWQLQQWANSLAHPLPGVGYYMSRQHQDGWPTVIDTFPTMGLCTSAGCECMAPFRGPRCDLEDPGAAIAKSRRFNAAIILAVSAIEWSTVEVTYILIGIWRHFNSRFDYPVVVFHDGLTSHVQARLAFAAPHRIWFHDVSGYLRMPFESTNHQGHAFGTMRPDQSAVARLSWDRFLQYKCSRIRQFDTWTSFGHSGVVDTCPGVYPRIHSL